MRTPTDGSARGIGDQAARGSRNRCNEFTEKLASMSRSTEEPTAAIKALQEKKEAEAPPPPPAAVPENDSSESVDSGVPSPTGANVVPCKDEDFTREQKESLEKLKADYTAAGGVLDKFGSIFLLRFLVDADWKYAKAKKKAEATAAWRAKSGVNDFRKQCDEGLSFDCIPKMRELFTTVAVANCHSLTRQGDFMNFIDYGSLNVAKFFKARRDQSRRDVALYRHRCGGDTPSRGGPKLWTCEGEGKVLPRGSRGN